MNRPTAKYWLYFLRGYPTRQDPVQLPRTIEKYDCLGTPKNMELITIGCIQTVSVNGTSWKSDSLSMDNATLP